MKYGGRHTPPERHIDEVETNEEYNKKMYDKTMRQQEQAFTEIEENLKTEHKKQQQQNHEKQELKEQEKQQKEQQQKEQQKLNYNKLLTDIFYKQHNYDGVNELFRKAKLLNNSIKRGVVSEWLKLQTVNQLTHSQPTNKPENLPIYAEDKWSYQIDLTFLPMYKDENDGNYVMFTAINIDSRYAFASFSKNKEGATILKLLNDFYDDCGICNAITMDSGTEFTNKECMKWFQEKEIKTYFVVGDSHKLGIINRFHRTLKSKIEKYMLANDSTRWIDILATIIKNYNNTVNRGIGYTPKEGMNSMNVSNFVSKARESTVRIQSHKPVYEVGQLVRILKERKVFAKTQVLYSEEVYKIFKINLNTVSVADDDENVYTGIKKKYLLILPTDYKPDMAIGKQKKQVEAKHKVKSKIKKEGVDVNFDSQELAQSVKSRTDRKKKIIVD